MNRRYPRIFAQRRPAGRRPAATLGRAAGAALLLLTLGGCYTPRPADATIPPNDYRLRHPISLHEGDRTVELFIGSNRGGLTPSQRADVLAFGRTWRREATGGVVIDVPAGTVNARAAADALREIRSLLHAAGIPARGIYVRSYRPVDPLQLATIRLNYPKIVADAGPCGLWPTDLGPTLDPSYLENRPYWNLGCATQHNLAAMVENPADIAQPRGETSAYEPRRSVVLEKYRRGESTQTINPQANQGKISDVGK